MSNIRFEALKTAWGHEPVQVKPTGCRASVLFAEKVFTREKMKEYIASNVLEQLFDLMDNEKTLTRDIANSVAIGMKKWAMEQGATHYTHWFQPLTGGTAEKHDAFLDFGDDGAPMEKFSGSVLYQQEPDASSFPSGGLRNTFEARGYSAWDPSSPAFVIGDRLCIPTIFVAFTGEALDYKTPLLRSITAVNKAAVAVANYFDKNVKRVYSYLGWEQEYFLVDEALFAARPDLVMTGRTLIGHYSSKSQQLDDHYFGIIPERVLEFMKELEIEAQRLGIPVKTRHNEVAPNQFELAPIYEECNLGSDHNQLVMSLMEQVARRHHFRVLLHEKPFGGVNGSGKHCNWSLGTNTGVNLLAPGKNPYQNLEFVTFLVNVLMAVQRHNGLLKASIISATNAHRLGANEAPPAIISVFLGSQLTEALNEIENADLDKGIIINAKKEMKLGVGTIPEILLDNTDRNRTSPFAFTGNKFEFRMLGSAQSISGPNVVLNTIVAESLDRFADALEGAEDFNKAAYALVAQVMRDHKRIIFNGNNYSDEWVEEAERRGLLNLKTSADALPRFKDRKNIDLFVRHGVFSETEVVSRTDIMLEEYAKILHIEALCMERMVQQDILPAGMKFTNMVLDSLQKKAAVGLDTGMEQDIAQKATELCRCIAQKNTALSQAVDGADM